MQRFSNQQILSCMPNKKLEPSSYPLEVWFGSSCKSLGSHPADFQAMAQDWAEGIRANSLLINPAYYCSQTAIVGVLSEPYPNFRLMTTTPLVVGL